MKIGVDIDECICYLAQPILDILNKNNNTTHTLDDITKYNIEECLNISDPEIIDAVDKAIVSKLKLIENAPVVVEWLSKYADIYFLTKRSYKHADITRELLYSLNTPNILFMEANKVKIINKLSIDYMIEDRAKYAYDIVMQTTCTVLLIDKPWNRHVEHTKIIRVYDWKDIMIYFLKVL